MKVGDLVKQTQDHGGCLPGAIGLVIEEDNSQKTTPRWTVLWFSGNIVHNTFRIGETTGYGYGIEVISEAG